MRTKSEKDVQSNWQVILQIVVTLSVGGLLLSKFVKQGTIGLNLYGMHAVDRERGSGRNERSTPRSFILPATPAVASIQNGRKEGVDSERMAKCVAELRMLGYQIDGDEDLLNAKLIEAIFRFQAERGLPTTGEVDELTARTLRCS